MNNGISDVGFLIDDLRDGFSKQRRRRPENQQSKISNQKSLAEHSHVSF
jgi:hypothetical protein